MTVLLSKCTMRDRDCFQESSEGHVNFLDSFEPLNLSYLGLT